MDRQGGTHVEREKRMETEMKEPARDGRGAEMEMEIYINRETVRDGRMGRD